MSNELESWCRGILLKRSPDALRIIADLLEAGLKRGQCSANDIRDVRFDEPNIIGGVFRILPRFGFQQTDRRVKPLVARKNGRKVYVWELVDHEKARTVQRILTGILVSHEDPQLAWF